VKCTADSNPTHYRQHNGAVCHLSW
jgi:hypothetical protein